MGKETALQQVLDFLAMIAAKSYLVYSGQEPVNLASMVPILTLGLLTAGWMTRWYIVRKIETERFIARHQLLEEMAHSAALIAPPYSRWNTCMMWLVGFVVVLAVVVGATGYLMLTQG